MEHSDSILELAKALSKCQGEMKSVPKDSANPFFKSKYASLDAIWDTIRKPLSANGLSVIQTTYDQTDKIFLETMLLHTSGEWFKTYLPINAAKNDPQSIGSAMTYARRYSLSGILGISADEDDDAEATTAHKEQAKPTVKTTTPSAVQNANSGKPEAPQGDKIATEKQVILLRNISTKMGYTPEKLTALLYAKFGAKCLKLEDVLMPQVNTLIASIEQGEGL